MKPIYLKIPPPTEESIYTEHYSSESEYLANPLHFHPEVEILLVQKGTGTRIIGSAVDYFGPGSIAVIGSNVPHVWHFDEKFRFNKKPSPEYIFILFNTDILTESFWKLPEVKKVLELIKNSQRGISLNGKTLKEVSLLMKSIYKASGFKKISLLLSILEIISSGEEYKFLSGPFVPKTFKDSDSERLNTIYDYLLKNFREDITLEHAASLACLSSSAFCRYFKKRTNKTFIHFLNEIRITHACKLLTEGNQSVTSIGYSCGFTNVSHFIQQFKKMTGYTPLNYKRKYNNNSG